MYHQDPLTGKTLNNWCWQQSKSTLHILALIIFGFFTFISCFVPGTILIGYFIFFIVTAGPMLWRMLIICAIVTLIGIILPFLAPLIFIVMIIFFIMRISYIINNWRPVIAGLLFYGAAIPLSIFPFSLFFIAAQANSLIGIVATSLITTLISVAALHLLLNWLYTYKYNSKTALGIMGSVPLIIITLLLPFLKTIIGDTFFDSHHFGDTTDPIPETTGYTHIEPYIRTNPDGIAENNLSYHGDNAIPVNEHIHYVKKHIRTNPDGILKNNLSYREE